MFYRTVKESAIPGLRSNNYYEMSKQTLCTKRIGEGQNVNWWVPLVKITPWIT